MSDLFPYMLQYDAVVLQLAAGIITDFTNSIPECQRANGYSCTRFLNEVAEQLLKEPV